MKVTEDAHKIKTSNIYLFSHAESERRKWYNKDLGGTMIQTGGYKNSSWS